MLPIAIALGLLCVAGERLRPARPLPSVPGWWPRALLANLAQIGVVLLGGVAWDHWFGASIFDLGGWPPIAAGALVYLVTTFIYYWWHRARHHSDRLWLMFHQIHHSTHRLEAATAFYAHPSDFMANALIVSGVSYVLLGYGLEAAAWTSFWVGVFDLWEHTNIRTPRWLGYVVVRPEMHRVHHERDRHRSNYGIPIWDMLFGTYENSLRAVDCGFTPAQEGRIFEMLRFRSADR